MVLGECRGFQIRRRGRWAQRRRCRHKHRPNQSMRDRVSVRERSRQVRRLRHSRCPNSTTSPWALRFWGCHPDIARGFPFPFAKILGYKTALLSLSLASRMSRQGTPTRRFLDLIFNAFTPLASVLRCNLSTCIPP